MKTAIPLTWDHIRNGKVNNFERCPMALAIKDEFPEITSVNVHTENIYILSRYSRYSIRVSNTEYGIPFMFDIFGRFLPWWMLWIVGLRPGVFHLDIPDDFLPKVIVKPRLRFSLLARLLARVELRGLPGILRNRASDRPGVILSK